VFPHDGDSYESLLAKADSRMYRNKVERKSESPTRRDAAAMAAQDSQAKAG
jgi:predicted signal transduction protein with EAL and GGDEF domain